MATSDILDKIIATKAEEVIAAQMRASLRRRSTPRRVPPIRRATSSARCARKIAAGRPAVIAEIKKASPSKGVLRETFDPPAIAASYERAGAACLSVLTDRPFFQGAAEYLVAARAACALPALRKEFIVDEYQVAESRALGADAILLIVSALDDARLAALEAAAHAITAWTCWSRCTTATSSTARCGSRTPLLGINNRNLRNFSVTLDTTFNLLARVPADRLVVTESGILAPRDVALMRRTRRARLPRRRGIHACARSGRGLDGAVRRLPVGPGR